MRQKEDVSIAQSQPDITIAQTKPDITIGQSNQDILVAQRRSYAATLTKAPTSALTAPDDTPLDVQSLGPAPWMRDRPSTQQAYNNPYPQPQTQASGARGGFASGPSGHRHQTASGVQPLMPEWAQTQFGNPYQLGQGHHTQGQGYRGGRGGMGRGAGGNASGQSGANQMYQQQRRPEEQSRPIRRLEAQRKAQGGAQFQQHQQQ